MIGYNTINIRTYFRCLRVFLGQLCLREKGAKRFHGPHSAWQSRHLILCTAWLGVCLSVSLLPCDDNLRSGCQNVNQRRQQQPQPRSLLLFPPCEASYGGKRRRPWERDCNNPIDDFSHTDDQTRKTKARSLETETPNNVYFIFLVTIFYYLIIPPYKSNSYSL